MLCDQTPDVRHEVRSNTALRAWGKACTTDPGHFSGLEPQSSTWITKVVTGTDYCARGSALADVSQAVKPRPNLKVSIVPALRAFGWTSYLARRGSVPANL